MVLNFPNLSVCLMGMHLATSNSSTNVSLLTVFENFKIFSITIRFTHFFMDCYSRRFYHGYNAKV